MESYKELMRRENMELLLNHPLFEGLDSERLTEFLEYLKPDLAEAEPGQHIPIEPGNRRRMGIVIEGTVKVHAIDYSGHKTVVNVLNNHGAVGTMQFMADYYNMLYEITAVSPSVIVFFDPQDLLITREEIAAVQHKVLANLLLSQRSLFISLSEHLVCLSQKTLREKALHYLQICCKNQHRYEIDIPLSREDLASYLAVDRASLSRTLGELRREGVIDFKKNHFKILDISVFRY